MAVLAGFLAGAPDWITSENPYLSPQLSEITDPLFFDGRIYGDTSPMPVGAHNSQFHQSAQGRVIQGWIAPNYHEDFYYRIHMTPRVVDVGNVISNVNIPIQITNMYLSTVLVTQIDDPNIDGLIFNSPPTPFSMLPLYSTALSLDVTTNVPPSVDTSFGFHFSTGIIVQLPVLARRVVLYPFQPLAGYEESFEWQTKILTTRENEQRISLRSRPRRTIKHKWLLDDEQFSQTKNFAAAWSHRQLGLPVWHDAQRIAQVSINDTQIMLDTVGREYMAGGQAVVWKSETDNEVVEIQSVAADRLNLSLVYPRTMTDAYVMPIVYGHTLDGFSFERITGQYVQTSAEVFITRYLYSEGDSYYPQYLGEPVWTECQLIVSPLSERIARSVEVFDYGSGPIVVDTKTDFARNRQSVSMVRKTREEKNRLKAFLNSRRGKQVGFWLPSFNKDFVPVASLAVGATSATVKFSWQSQFFTGKHLLIQLKDGSRYFTRMSGAVKVAETETIGFDPPLSNLAMIGADDIEYICTLSHVRLDTDSVEFEYDQVNNLRCNFAVLETPL